MDNPYKYLSDAFQPEFDVRFVVERLDGGTLLVLSQGEQVQVRRALSSGQLTDSAKLAKVVESIRFGLAIDRGEGMSELAVLSEPPTHR